MGLTEQDCHELEDPNYESLDIKTKQVKAFKSEAGEHYHFEAHVQPVREEETDTEHRKIKKFKGYNLTQALVDDRTHEWNAHSTAEIRLKDMEKVK